MCVGSSDLVVKLVDADRVAVSGLQGLQLGKDLRTAMGVLQSLLRPGFHQQQVIRRLGGKEIIVFQVALLVDGVFPDAQAAQSLIEVRPLAGLAVIGDVSS